MTVSEYIVLGLEHKTDPLYARHLMGRKVLDIGCGAGDFVARDPQMFTGIDLDPVLVDSCVSRGLSVERMSAFDLKFADQSFEAVRAAQLIEHFQPQEASRFLAEASRVLEPGGVVYLTTPGIRNVWNTFSHIRPYPPTAFIKLLGSVTENYIRESRIELNYYTAYGSRKFFRTRFLSFLAGIFDVTFPPSDPIGWTIILKKAPNLNTRIASKHLNS